MAKTPLSDSRINSRLDTYVIIYPFFRIYQAPKSRVSITRLIPAQVNSPASDRFKIIQHDHAAGKADFSQGLPGGFCLLTTGKRFDTDTEKLIAARHQGLEYRTGKSVLHGPKHRFGFFRALKGRYLDGVARPDLIRSELAGFGGRTMDDLAGPERGSGDRSCAPGTICQHLL